MGNKLPTGKYQLVVCKQCTFILFKFNNMKVHYLQSTNWSKPYSYEMGNNLT